MPTVDVHRHPPRLAALRDCPGFLWSGRSLIACDHCQHRAWDHDRRLTPTGRPAYWPPGLVGYWLRQDLIDPDRATHLRSLQPDSNPPATIGATR